MVDVEQRALSALEQYEAVGLDGVEQESCGIGYMRRQPLGEGVVAVEYLLGVQLHVIGQGGEDFVFRADDPLDSRTEVGPVHVA